MFKLRTLADRKGGFFDREAVIKAVDKATRDVLSRFGAFVRQTARTSMKQAPRPVSKMRTDRSGKPRRDASGKIMFVLKFKYSPPGSPPFARTGHIKRGVGGVNFNYDKTSKSVVIGASLLPGWPNSKILPLHEYGGVVAYTGKKGGSVRKKYPARPYMLPAFNKELPTLPELWRGSVKG